MGHNIYDFQSLDLTPITPLPTVRFGDGSVIQATGVGSVAFHTESGSIMKLTDVLYIPTLTINLFSAKRIVEWQKFVFENDQCLIYKNG
jgi:hypothetical protein